MTEPIVAIVNPASGGGRCRRMWPAIARRLNEANIPFTATMTERQGDGTRLAREALRAGATTVIAVGGDGTANEVINGFFADDVPVNPAARFALISAGMGNDLSAVLGLRGDAAIAALGPGGVTGHVDLLRVRFTGPDGDPACRYAMLGLFLGIVAEGAGIAIPSWAKRFGRSAYLGAGALAVLHHHPRHITYRIDDGPEQAAWINGGIVANAPRIGGGLPIAPNAQLDDGMADAILLRAVGRAALLTRIMPRLQRGTHLAHPAISHAPARQVTIETDDDLLLAIDGEIIGHGSAAATVLPGALPVALPPGTRLSEV
jgi:YegS/Rv2252/BmrU family lipid kinase